MNEFYEILDNNGDWFEPEKACRISDCVIWDTGSRESHQQGIASPSQWRFTKKGEFIRDKLRFPHPDEKI